MILRGVVSYLAGLWLGPYLVYFPLSFIGALLIVGIVFTWLERHWDLDRQMGFVLFALLVGGIGHAHWVSVTQLDSTLRDAGSQHSFSFEGTIVAPIRQTPDACILVVEVKRIQRQGEWQRVYGRLRLTWRESGALSLGFGDDVAFTARIREPYGTQNPGGFHYGDYLKRRGIHAVGTVQGSDAIRIQDVQTWNLYARLLNRVDHWRQRIHQAAVSGLTNPALGLFLGMVVGEQSFIEQDIRDAFMASGTVHILSISGSHLGLLAVLIFAGARGSMCLLPAYWLERLSLHLTATRCAILVTLPAVTFYTLLAGAEMATVRSWIMIVVCSVGVWLGRERNLLTALAVAALLMVLPHPEAIHDISFQLSYLSVAAIALVVLARKEDEENCSKLTTIGSSTQHTWSMRLWHKALLAWLVTLAVSLATLPLVAYHFHQIPWLGLFTNMVIVPMVGMLMIPIGLFSAVAVLVGGGQTLPLASVNQWMFDWLAHIVVGLSSVPNAAWYVASPTLASIILYWALLVALTLWWHRRDMRLCGVGLVLAIVLWWGWSPRTGWEPGILRVTFLDVGQGDATLLELPDGQIVLIDAGPAYRRLDMGRAVIGPYLWNHGIKKLDHVIATHPQWDHVGGLPWVLETFEVDRYWSNGISRPEKFFQQLQLAVHSAGLHEQEPVAGTEIVRTESCTLTVLSPFSNLGEKEQSLTTPLSGKALNNQSIVTRLKCGEHSFLLTADAEQGALDTLLQLPDGFSARVVKVPHHGAKSSLHREWVHRLQTEMVVISVGAHNRYGHPAPDVLQAYQQRDLPVYRTDRDGAVWLTAALGSHEMTITTARQKRLFPVQVSFSMWAEERRNWSRILTRM